MFYSRNNAGAYSRRYKNGADDRTGDCPRRRLLLWLLPFLLAFVAGVAQQPDQSAPAAARTWRISGKVVDGRSGQALARCVVEINPTTARNRSLSTETGDDGQFVFDGLSLGKYQLSAARRGYLTQSYQEHESFSTAVAVGPELKSEGLLFNLTPQAIFYGVVTDETGEPVRRAQVQLFEDRDRDGVRSTQHRQTVMTDDRGMYEIPNIAPANYFLAVTAQPWYARGAGSMVMHLSNAPGGAQENETASQLDVAYATTFYPNATDSDDATPVPIKGGERVEIDLTLVAQHATRLRLPIPRDEQGRFGVSLTQSIFGQAEQVATGMQMSSDGVMEVDGILPGRYDVTLTTYAGNRPEVTQFSADLAGGATRLNEAGGTEEVSVVGKVISIDAKIPSGSISLFSSHPRRDYGGPIDRAGEFSIKVPPGAYEVIGRIPQMYLASVASPNAAVKGRMLEVKAGDAPKLEIISGSGWGQIDGVAESSGHATGGVMVVLAPEDAKDNHILFRRDQSDSDGTFSLFNIIPGRYRLLAIDGGWDLAWADPNVLGAFLKKSIPIQIRANEKLKQTIEVQVR
jgi:hypothetical protein